MMLQECPTCKHAGFALLALEGSLIGSLALVSTCCPLDASLRRHAVGGPLALERSLNFLPTQVSAKQATVAATPKARATLSR